jgi:two-component system LytT family response regulator
MIRAVIVEDENIARDVLSNYVAKYCPDVQVIGQAEHIKQAVPLIHKLKPDLVFLDVEMPFGNGFDVLEACKDISFETIFITAYAQYAIKALNVAAAYYLLKPINIEDLIQAIQKVNMTIEAKEKINKNQIIIDNLHEEKFGKKQLVLPTIDGYDIVKLENIIRLQGNGNFTDIYLKDKSKKMVCRFLKFFEENLPSSFIRVHKSHIINVHFVKSYHKGSGGYVDMEDGSEVEISPTYKEAFLDKLMC